MGFSGTFVVKTTVFPTKGHLEQVCTFRFELYTRPGRVWFACSCETNRSGPGVDWIVFEALMAHSSTQNGRIVMYDMGPSTVSRQKV